MACGILFSFLVTAVLHFNCKLLIQMRVVFLFQTLFAELLIYYQSTCKELYTNKNKKRIFVEVECNERKTFMSFSEVS